MHNIWKIQSSFSVLYLISPLARSSYPHGFSHHLYITWEQPQTLPPDLSQTPTCISNSISLPGRFIDVQTQHVQTEFLPRSNRAPPAGFPEPGSGTSHLPGSQNPPRAPISLETKPLLSSGCTLVLSLSIPPQLTLTSRLSPKHNRYIFRP